MIYRLPPDGAWVRYRCSAEGRGEVSIPPGVEIPTDVNASADMPLTMYGVLTLSSVGQAVVAGEACRWIEVKTHVEINGSQRDPWANGVVGEGAKRRMVVKLLIPERKLVAGSDPLSHVRKLYFKVGDRKPELVDDEKGKQYEIDRLRIVFPASAE